MDASMIGAPSGRVAPAYAGAASWSGLPGVGGAIHVAARNQEIDA